MFYKLVNRRVIYYRPLSAVLVLRALLHTTPVARTSNGGSSREIPTLSLPKAKKYFLTTPIFYVNAVPHIGHLHTAVLSDAIARWHRILGCDVVFSTGTDEHGLKIQQASKSTGKDPGIFCDERLFQLANISHTDFIRTTEARHRKTAQHLWEMLYSGGHIYKGHYSGWYCTSDEMFLSDDEVVDTTDKHGHKIKVSSDSGRPVEWTEEENYMFRLSSFAPQLVAWLDQKVIEPLNFEPLVRSWLSRGLPDISISRQHSRLQWGIPVPGDDTQTMYVWLDALSNYLTVAGFPDQLTHWPADCHVIGKDILRFHAIYWPAFLMAAGLQPPRKILCHSHWTIDHTKMSKSLGNVVDPFDRLHKYTSDGLRYFLLKEGVPHSDGSYSDARLVELLNTELANTLGNLLGRCTGLRLNADQIVPGWQPHVWACRATKVDQLMMDSLRQLPGIVDGHYRDYNIYKGLDAIMAQLRRTNAFVQSHAPWELVEKPSEQTWLHTVIHVTMESLRVAAILLQPATPDLADRLLSRLNIDVDSRKWEDLQHRKTACVLGEDCGILFEKIKTS